VEAKEGGEGEEVVTEVFAYPGEGEKQRQKRIAHPTKRSDFIKGRRTSFISTGSHSGSESRAAAADPVDRTEHGAVGTRYDHERLRQRPRTTLPPAEEKDPAGERKRRVPKTQRRRGASCAARLSVVIETNFVRRSSTTVAILCEGEITQPSAREFGILLFHAVLRQQTLLRKDEEHAR